mgnify:CR=1 FL=1
MKAAVLHAPADLRVEEVPVPEIGAQEVLVRVMAAGICGSDIGRVMVTGTYRFPTIPGHEFAGEVAAVGAEVTHLAPGDRVAVAPLMPCGQCAWCQAGKFSLCDSYDFMGSRSDGAFAEYLKAPARNVLKVPESVSFEEAATIEPAAIILHGIHKLNIALGDAVAVVGCGALGYFALQFARLSGAQPLIAPPWFDCFNAERIGRALETGEAIAFLSVPDITPGVDRVVAVFPDGAAFAWHQLNDKLKEDPNARLAD